MLLLIILLSNPCPIFHDIMITPCDSQMIMLSLKSVWMDQSCVAVLCLFHPNSFWLVLSLVFLIFYVAAIFVPLVIPLSRSLYILLLIIWWLPLLNGRFPALLTLVCCIPLIQRYILADWVTVRLQSITTAHKCLWLWKFKEIGWSICIFICLYNVTNAFLSSPYFVFREISENLAFPFAWDIQGIHASILSCIVGTPC